MVPPCPTWSLPAAARLTPAYHRQPGRRYRSRLRPTPEPAGPGRDDAPQDDGIVVLRVARRVDQRHPAGRRPSRELPQRRTGRWRLELPRVLDDELSPSPGIMREPATQGMARCDILRPAIQRES